MNVETTGDIKARAFLESEQRALLGTRISELGLSLRGTVIEQMVNKLYEELGARGLAFRPPVYLSDEWGCPDGVPIIGVPFYLADSRLSRIEEEVAVEVEGETDIMCYLRHEAGHAFNYAYRLYERSEWQDLFGSYSRPYKEHFRVNPFSNNYVRHILGWYAQKHPDEDFAETFAVWLTPGSDWLQAYDGWPVLAKLNYVDRVMRDLAQEPPVVPPPSETGLAQDMQQTIAEHYRAFEPKLPIADTRQFDRDLRMIFSTASPGPDAPYAADFLRHFRRELVRRTAYWTGENSVAVRSLVDLLVQRAETLQLRVAAPTESVLIDVTAFVTAVMMNYRYTDVV